MAQTYPLDKVIRVVDPDYRVTSPNERMVGIDLSTFKAIEVIDLHGRTRLERVGFLGRFKPRKYLVVSNNTDVQNEVEGPTLRFELRDFTHDWRLGLQLKYLASCSTGNEVKLAEALANGPHPGAVLNDLINRWIKEYAGTNQADFIDNYYARRDDFMSHLSARAIAEVGLNLTASIQLEAESTALGPIVIPPIHFPVRFKDYNEEQDLKFEAEVEVNPDKKILALLYVSRNNSIEELIRTRTREYFATSVSLHTFHTTTDRGYLERELKKYLDTFLGPYGRQLAFVSLGKIDEGDTFFEAKKDVKFDDIQEYDDPVVIKNTVQMTLRDYAFYRNSGVPTLTGWIDENLTEVIREVLFGKRYIDLLVGFGPLEKEIKEKLSQRAEKIGYSIRHLITVPDLPPYDWLDNFDVEVLDREYETNMPKFPVRLGVIVTTRIRDLQDIADYLNRRQDVPKLMKSAIEIEVRRFLHKVDPERFYMRFSYSEDENEPTIEHALSELIHERLEEKFKAQIIGVVFRMEDTEITSVWSTLEKSEGELVVNLPSFSDAEGVTIRARVRVEAIHARGWNRFRTSTPDIIKICKLLSEHVLSQLGTFANADLVFTHLEGQRQVEKTVEALAKKYALEEFGLLIRVSNIRREATDIENQERERIQGLLRARQVLETRRIEAITGGGTKEEIGSFEELIGKINEELPGSVVATQRKFTRLEVIEPAPPTRFADLKSRKSLTAGAGSSRNNGSGDSE